MMASSSDGVRQISIKQIFFVSILPVMCMYKEKLNWCITHVVLGKIPKNAPSEKSGIAK